MAELAVAAFRWKILGLPAAPRIFPTFRQLYFSLNCYGGYFWWPSLKLMSKILTPYGGTEKILNSCKEVKFL
jgi:hypothetical protein